MTTVFCVLERLVEIKGSMKEQAATGWNSLAILKLLKLATVTAISTRTVGSPTLRRDVSLTAG